LVAEKPRDMLVGAFDRGHDILLVKFNQLMCALQPQLEAVRAFLQHLVEWLSEAVPVCG
jgi:hypothetical protein